MSQIKNEIRFRAVLDASGAIKGYEEIKDMEAVTREAAEKPIQLYVAVEGVNGSIEMIEAELLGVQKTAEKPIRMDLQPPDLEPTKAEIESVQEKAAEPVQVKVEAELDGLDKKTQEAIQKMQQELEGQLRYQLVIDPSTGEETLKRFSATTEEVRKAAEKPIQLYTMSPDMKLIEAELLDFRQKAEEPMQMEFDVEAAVAGIRDLTIIVQGAIAAIKKLTGAANELLDAAHAQRQAMIITKVAFGDAAGEMANYAASIQDITNYQDHRLLPLMAKMAQTYKLNKDEIKQLTPAVLDFAEAHKATGMTVERAFDLMGRALNGHTEFLGRIGLEFDKTRLAAEGVSYIIEKLGEDYGGTAEALADLRIQNANTWTEIKESVGDMLHTIVSPVLKGLKWLMEAYQNLSPVAKGFVTGLTVAIPVIVTTTAVISALTAAVHALKVAINPVAGIIGIAVGAVSALAFGLAAAKTQTEEVTTAQKTLKDEIADAEKQVATEAERFRILSSRLLELRSATSLTIADKKEMKSLIKSLNDNYGEYLGNINLETASYEELAAAITSASEALVQKKVAEVYGKMHGHQLEKVAMLQIQIDKTTESYKEALEVIRPYQDFAAWSLTDDNPMGSIKESDFFKDDEVYQAAMEKVTTYRDLENQLEKAKENLATVTESYRQALLDVPDLTYEPKTKGGSSRGGGLSDEERKRRAEEERRRKEAIRLMEELANLRLTETERIQQEYERRLALINEFTEKDSEAQKTAIENLNAWKGQQDDLLKNKQLKAEIDYYSTLESLGVDSYENLKAAMNEYYAWALENLSEKEQQIIQAQIAQMEERRAKIEEERRKEAEKAREEELKRLQELEDIRHDFHVRGLELDNKFYQAELIALEKYYAERHQKLIEAGLTEEEIERQKLQAKQALRMTHDQQSLNATSSVLGNIADLQNKETKKGFKRWQAMAIMQGYVDTFSAAIAAYRAMVGIPFVGPGLAVAAAAAAIAAGVSNIEKIKDMEYEPPQAATGGHIRGRSHRDGGTIIEAEDGEYIMAKDRVKALGKRFFDFLNFAPEGQVKLAFAGLPVPSVPVRQATTIQYASGGSVTTGLPSSSLVDTIAAIKEELVSLRQIVKERPNQFHIEVDPLSNDPVKVSEIADTGRLIRSEI